MKTYLYKSGTHIVVSIILSITLCSCVVPHSYTGPSRATYTLDISITTDPPDAEIISTPTPSRTGMDVEYTDYGYEKYGRDKATINWTPFNTKIQCMVEPVPGGMVNMGWLSDQYGCGGDAIMLVKLAVKKNKSTFYTSYHHALILNFELKHDGYESEFVSIDVAEGEYPLIDLIKEASAEPIVIHRVLRKK